MALFYGGNTVLIGHRHRRGKGRVKKGPHQILFYLILKWETQGLRTACGDENDDWVSELVCEQEEKSFVLQHI